MPDEVLVKVRKKGLKAWAFLSRKGTTRLRIHALRFTAERAAALIKDNAPDNPEWEWKVSR